MTHQHLIRQIARTADESQVDPWDDPQWDAFRFFPTTEGDAVDFLAKDGRQHFVATDVSVFWAALGYLRQQMVGPVRVMRIYQFQPEHCLEGDYLVFFVASFVYQRGDVVSCMELRFSCGAQDLDQDSDSHLASINARAVQQDVEAGCRALGIDVIEGLFVEEQS